MDTKIKKLHLGADHLSAVQPALLARLAQVEGVVLWGTYFTTEQREVLRVSGVKGLYGLY